MTSRFQIQRNAFSLLAPFALFACCGLAAATDAPGNISTQPPAVASVERPALALSPLHQEIQLVLEQERSEVMDLVARIAQEHDGQKLLELQRAVELAKQRAQISVLEVQIRHARAAGKAETVAELETSLQQLRQPQPLAQPVERQK